MTLAALFRVEVADLVPDRQALFPEARHPESWDPSLVDQVLVEAEKWANEPDVVLPFSAFCRFPRDGDRQEYEAHYFRRRQKLVALGLAVVTGRGGRFVSVLENLVWAVCEEYTWALPAHIVGHPDPSTTVDLFAAETASALAELVSLAGDRFRPETVVRVVSEVRRRVLVPYLSDRPPWDWESADHNWAAVCGGGVGLAALWLADDAEVVAVLNRLGPTLDGYLSGFPADGLCLEGMGYWTYGMGYFTALVELLQDRSGGVVDVWADAELKDRLTKIARFPWVGRLGRDQFVRFSDGEDEFRYPGGTVSRLALRLGLADDLPPDLAETLASDFYARWVRHLRDLAWGRGSHGPSTSLAKAAAQWFPQSQWWIVRDAVGDVPVGLAAKGGHNGEPHNHNDVGSFQLVAGSESLVDDLGAGLYDRDYFGPRRFEYFVNSSRSHSVPLVNRCEQRAGATFGCRHASYQTTPAGARWSLDLAPAYGLVSLVSLVRTWEVSTPWATASLVDRFVWDGGGDVVERFVTRLPARAFDGRSVEILGTEARLLIVGDEVPESLVVTPEVYAPHHGPDRTAFCIDFGYPHLASGRELRFTFQLTPRSHP